MSAEVLTTLSTTVGLILAIGGGFAWMIHRMDHSIGGLRTELKGEIADLRTEIVHLQVAVARLEGRFEGRAEASSAAG